MPAIKKPILAAAAAIAVLFLAAGVAPAGDIDAKALSRKLDELYRSKTSRGRMTMTVTTPHYTRTLTMKVWSRGMDDTLIRILTPRKERGNASLKKGNEMWNYIAKIRKTTRIPPSLMMASWMGSDFTNDDLVKETTWEEDYFITLLNDPPPGQIGLVYTPRPEAPVTWSKVVAFLDAQTYLPEVMEYYDEKGRKVRVLTFSEIKNLGGKTIPTRLTLTPLSKDKKGRKTEIVYTEMEFDVPLRSDLFTLTNLRRDR